MEQICGITGSSDCLSRTVVAYVLTVLTPSTLRTDASMYRTYYLSIHKTLGTDLKS